ncbi:MAG: acyl-CoA dehydrogenase family protein [Terrimicrobium sp.]|jgi:alkylation response protein AidB-like acyl-CoA dehydrogenase|nr:acyl-CoA dehydrogenase family protein [Terrimicrobiaceae bacterium]
MKKFFQAPPRLGNQYDDDRVLRSFLRRNIVGPVLAEIEPGLRRLGARAAGEMIGLALEAERASPALVQFDAWGRRIDEIRVSPAWQAMHRIAAEEGIVATAYERRHAEARVHQFALLYLYHPSSAIYSCPLAMTDGAARVLEIEGEQDLRREIVPHLISRDPDTMWTAGQWMTERSGGSDVSGTETVARREGGMFRLYGEKWFTSATTSELALTLARIEDSRDLSLFLVRLRDEQGRMNSIRIERLKDKLGTRALPTAELLLEGTPARLIGGEGRGVKKIATMLNITRLYNACCAVGFMRRGLALARDYASRRHAFGKLLSEHPLHIETLASLQVGFEGSFHLVFFAAQLLGRDEVGTATVQERRILRLLTPLAKLFTAKMAVSAASEVLECLGGAGYVEDTGLPVLLRDSQVLPIWEGTTNVLSLDVLRVLQGEKVLEDLFAELGARLENIPAILAEARQNLLAALDQIRLQLSQLLAGDRAQMEACARDLAMELSRVVAGVLVIEHAAWSLASEGDMRPVVSAQRWCGTGLIAPSGALISRSKSWLRYSHSIAIDDNLSRVQESFA